MDIQRFTIIS